MHKQAQGKAYLVQLKESVRKMGELPWAIGERTVTLDTLREAEMILKQVIKTSYGEINILKNFDLVFLILNKF